jgi:hypothetical protein
MRNAVNFIGIFLPVFFGLIASSYFLRQEQFNGIEKYWRNIFLLIWLTPWAITIIKVTFFKK